MAIRRIEKLTIVGGGSSYTPEFVAGVVTHQEEVEVERLVLYDIQPERLQIVGGMVERMLRYAEVDSQVILESDRPAAIDGADFIVSSIRVGGMEARIQDERIPLKYNVIGQETTGPGGTLKALRTIPVTLAIAADVERLAPDAWYLNFTNPSGIITEAISRHSQVKVIGLCNNPINTQAEIARALGFERKQVFLEWVGLNHVNWVRRVYAGGRDLTQELLDRWGELPKDAGLPRFDPALVRALGVIPTYYLQYYYHTRRKLNEALKAEKSRGEVVQEVEQALFQKYQDPNQVIKPEELGLRGGARYSEAAWQVILSLMFDRRDVQVLDVRNAGSLPDLPEEAVVEVPCVVGARGPTPLHMGRLPDTIRALCQQVKSWESWTVEAGVTGSLDAARMAMISNPLIPSASVATALLDEMLAANREHLPQFFPPK